MPLLFDIQHFSIHNGPGIRTTVFFKGCPLHCLWCHNPESIKTSIERIYREERCIQCKACLAVCPQKKESLLPLDDSCRICHLCIDVCPTKALEIFGIEYTLDELLLDVLKDQVFYNESGGGVTLSGGEPLLQIDDLISLLKVLKSNKIHVALDTSGFAAWESLERTLPYVDLYLYDLKQMGEGRHKEATGVGVQLIHDNYRRLLQSGAHIWARIPMIPHFNTSSEDYEAMIRFLVQNPPEQVNLLPYHRSASRKYMLLGQVMTDYQSLDDEKIEFSNIARAFQQAGLNCQMGG